MDIIYKVQTSKNFETAIEDLKVSLGSQSFGVLWELNLRDKLREKGLEFEKNIKILEVCNPKQAKRALETQIEAGCFLPCKIVVYEDEGSVMIGMPRPTGLIGLIDNSGLSGVALDVETALRTAIDNAK